MKAEQIKVGIIGVGWYGGHIGIALSKEGYSVTLFEKDSEIFNGVSGKFGVRLHVGPHYPRSPATRKSCQQSYKEFCQTYPQLVNPHEYSIYALGERDADDQPSKVTPEQFKAVCGEFNARHEIKVDESEYRNLLVVTDIEEPSVAVGERLRKTFKDLLREAKVEIVYNFTVTETKKADDQIIVTNGKQVYQFDHVINTTGYQSILPIDRPPFDMEIVYQPCLALVYIDTLSPPTEKPFSFIVMDGWFPCIMPYDDTSDDSIISQRKYILTHGKWTILGSYPTSSHAQTKLSSVDEKFIQNQVRPSCEAHINHFWPEFSKRFQYAAWVGAVIAKIKTEKEFRSAVTLHHQPSGVTYVVPGKVSNIFDAEREVLALIKKDKVLEIGNYLYAEGGTLDSASAEIKEKPKPGSRSTCELQTYRSYEPSSPTFPLMNREKKQRAVQSAAQNIKIFKRNFEKTHKSPQDQKQRFLLEPKPLSKVDIQQYKKKKRQIQIDLFPSEPPARLVQKMGFIAENSEKNCKPVYRREQDKHPRDAVSLALGSTCKLLWNT